MKDDLFYFQLGFEHGYDPPSSGGLTYPPNENYDKGWLEGSKFRRRILQLVPSVTQDDDGKLLVSFPCVLSGITLEAKTHVETPSPIPDGYPIFTRLDNSLIKTGWSKTKRREYHHAIPHAVVEQVVDTLFRLDMTRNAFGSPVVVKNLPSISAYQVYDTMLWLRSVHMLVKSGGAKYKLAKPREELEVLWERIPEEEGVKV